MSRYVVSATWDDVPHLTTAQKEKLWASIPAYQRDARTKGIPQLGAGAIYPFPESEVACDPFPIPAFWPRFYALDVGWKVTAALFAAVDRDNDTLYLTGEYYAGQKEPSTHAQAIRARGAWLPGVIDPAARGRAQKDGEQLFSIYLDLGLNLTKSLNAVEAGIYAVYERIGSGRLRVFKTLANFWGEYRVYRRDEKGNIVKDKDHLMDDMRYCVLSGMDVAAVDPDYLVKLGHKPKIVTDHDPYAGTRDDV